MKIPVFGEKLPEKNYQMRQGAYIIITDEEKKHLLLVQAPNQAFFLPGGEIESGETKEATIHREVKEELGYQVWIEAYLGQADEYFYSRNRATYFHNPGYFFSAAGWEETGPPLEDFNQLKWFTIAEAIKQLKRGSHRWAVQTWWQEQQQS